MKNSSKGRELLFSVTKNDFELQTFRCGGHGGQGVNKRSTGVRLIHKDSGARGEARDERSFDQNRKNAFLRLIDTPKFKTWHMIETARRLGNIINIEAEVKKALDPKNLKVEVKDERGRWMIVEPNYPWEEGEDE